MSSDPARRPRPAALQAELRETAHGWVLTLRTDEHTAAALRSSALPGVLPSEITVRVLPNLVPADAFGLAAVRVVVDDTVAQDQPRNAAVSDQPRNAAANSGEE